MPPKCAFRKSFLLPHVRNLSFKFVHSFQNSSPSLLPIFLPEKAIVSTEHRDSRFLFMQQFHYAYLTPTAPSCDLFRQRPSRFSDELYLFAKHSIFVRPNHHHDNAFLFSQD